MDDVMANFFRPVSMFIKLLLPTLLRPMKAYSGKVLLGHMSTRLLLITNSADVMFMFFLCCSLMSVELDYFFGVSKNCGIIFYKSTVFFALFLIFAQNIPFITWVVIL